MFRVHVIYEPRLTRAEREMLARADRLTRLREVMQGPVREAINTVIRRQFETEGAAFGTKWKPLARSTRLAKIRAGVLNRGILVFSGAMKKGLLRLRPNDNRLRETGDSLELDVNFGVFPYPFHHLGAKGPGRRRLPKRQAFPSPAPLSFRRAVRGFFRSFLLTGRMPSGRFA